MTKKQKLRRCISIVRAELVQAEAAQSEAARQLVKTSREVKIKRASLSLCIESAEKGGAL